MTKETLDLGIAILAEAEVEAEARRLRQTLCETVETNALYSPDNLPHITLFQGCFPADARGEIEAAIAEQVDGLPELELKFIEELYLAEVSGNVFWLLERTEELFQFHL